MLLAFENLFNHGYMGGEAWLDGMLFALSHDPNGTESLVVGARDDHLPDYTRQTPGVHAAPYPPALWRRLVAAAERRARRAVLRPAEDPGVRWIAKHHAVDLWIGCTGFTGLAEHRPMLAWWPDFQHRRYPEYFGREGAEDRERLWSYTARRASGIVVLTEAVRQDALTAFAGRVAPEPERVHVCAIPPAIREDMLSISPSSASEEFGIHAPYFVVSNQFWQHKNHELIIRSLAAFHSGVGRSEISVLFTGLADDHRKRDHYRDILKLADELGVKYRCRFLGVVPRADQLALIRGAHAVIQPSRFEGQGAIVDESLALGARLLCSDIPPHRERALDYPESSVDFFEVDDVSCLAGLMEQSLDLEPKPRPAAEILSVVERQLRSAAQRFREICVRALAGRDDAEMPSGQ